MIEMQQCLALSIHFQWTASDTIAQHTLQWKQGTFIILIHLLLIVTSLLIPVTYAEIALVLVFRCLVSIDMAEFSRYIAFTLQTKQWNLSWFCMSNFTKRSMTSDTDLSTIFFWQRGKNEQQKSIWMLLICALNAFFWVIQNCQKSTDKIYILHVGSWIMH